VFDPGSRALTVGADKYYYIYAVCSYKKSYAPEPNLCPPKFPCGSCHKAVTWKTPGVGCDSCDKWYHQKCMGMTDAVYNGLGDVTWCCFKCEIPNFSSGIFEHSIGVESSPNILIIYLVTQTKVLIIQWTHRRHTKWEEADGRNPSTSLASGLMSSRA
jgi:hypothetical protein